MGGHDEFFPSETIFPVLYYDGAVTRRRVVFKGSHRRELIVVMHLLAALFDMETSMRLI